ncbi:surfeit locus protein 6 homolog [Adelges cooleyi]|uniref:surfeit locus protein 6 homolog n=1 Tax=Adelges cooleyi TaxID=133065 RepID=UPI0021803BFC|nr:surfeit locus protein 6 homolog [Adelges cooleyi]
MHLIMTSLKQEDVKDIFNKEFEFVSTVLSQVKLPVRVEDSDSEDSDCSIKVRKPILASDEIHRAQSLDELHTRLAAIREKKYTYRGKIIKNKLQNKIKRKKKIHEKIKGEKKSTDEVEKSAEKTQKVNGVKNGKAKLVFNKINFLGAETTSVPAVINTNAKQALEEIKSKQQLYEELEKSGETAKAQKLKEHDSWKNLLAKAEGTKVKDNVDLLKKTIARKDRQKKVSKTKWEERKNIVENTKKERQDKRTNNLLKRKQDKKEKIKKKAIKKGRFVPGVN